MPVGRRPDNDPHVLDGVCPEAVNAAGMGGGIAVKVGHAGRCAGIGQADENAGQVRGHAIAR